MEFNVEKINVSKKWATDEVAKFLLDNFNLKYGYDADTTFVIREESEIIATASRTKGVFKYFGILDEYKGHNISGKLINELMDDAFRVNIFHYFIFTSRDKVALFKGSNFKELVSNEYAALLEYGRPDISDYLNKIKGEIKTYNISDNTNTDTSVNRGAIVMNLNPMTNGHLYLINEARSQVDDLMIFIVSEDESIFPYEDRLKILKEETKYMEDVHVIEGGEYIISKATFPTYFLKKLDDDVIAYTYTDAQLFSEYIAKELGIKTRFVGDEPLDKVTDTYNKSLKLVLEEHGIKLNVIKRKELNDEIISASKVRKLIKEGNMEKAYEFIPNSTKEYLESEKGKEVILKIQNS